jgi:hypothetical protein
MSVVYESQESSSPMITRAVAAGLKGAAFNPYEFHPLETVALEVLGQFPQALAQLLIPRVQRSKALEPSSLSNVHSSDLVRSRIQDYAGIEEPFPAVIIGAGMGGATAHISLALGAPFLPQAFVMTLDKGSKNGNVQEYLKLSQDLARQITAQNPDLVSIQHYDPIHDGWLVRRVNHLRLKLIELPGEYKTFIRDRVKKGGSVLFLDGGAQWLQYRLGDRTYFQVGGWGDISPEEYLEGSERITTFCKKEGLKSTRWQLKDYPLERRTESEWGTEPGLDESIRRFCLEEGLQFVKIRFEDPFDFSLLAYRLVKEQFKRQNVETNGTLVEVFSQYDPLAVYRYGLLPLWLIFNTRDSLRYLANMAKEFEHDKPLLVSLLSTFSVTPDMAGWEEWQECLKTFSVVHIGARRTHFPADPLTLVKWQTQLNRWGVNHQVKKVDSIDATIVEKIAAQIQLEKQSLKRYE